MTDIPADILQPTLYNLRHRTSGRRVRSALADLVASPQDLTIPLRMPAGALLALSHSVGLVAGATTTSLGNGASFSTPTLAADTVYKGVWAEAGQDVTVAGVPIGTLSLYYIDPLSGDRRVIGTLTVV